MQTIERKMEHETTIRQVDKTHKTDKTWADKDIVPGFVTWNRGPSRGTPKSCPTWDTSPWMQPQLEQIPALQPEGPGLSQDHLRQDRHPFSSPASRNTAVCDLLTDSKPWRQNLSSLWRTPTLPMGRLNPIPQWGRQLSGGL